MQKSGVGDGVGVVFSSVREFIEKSECDATPGMDKKDKIFICFSGDTTEDDAFVSKGNKFLAPKIANIRQVVSKNISLLILNPIRQDYST
jgi:hypothetical protein